LRRYRQDTQGMTAHYGSGLFRAHGYELSYQQRS
jgi:hypothetical protein